jgi:hypothetical protein
VASYRPDQPPATEPITERIGMCRIGEAVPHVELLVFVPPVAVTDLNAALAVEPAFGEQIEAWRRRLMRRLRGRK